ncbi:MAG: hypothetical protein AAGF92_09870 [Myxococcota bacterium]
MKPGYIIFFGLVALYVGVEAVAMSRARHRMKADYIYPRIVTARTAATRCGEVSEADLARFDVVMDRERRRLRRELTADGSEADFAVDVEEQIRVLASAAEADLVATVEGEGCGAEAVTRSLRHFEIYKTK